MATLTRKEAYIVTEATKILDRYKDKLEYETALQVFAQKLSTHGKVRPENVYAYAYRFDGIRMLLPYIDWVGLATPNYGKERKIYADVVRRLFSEDLNKFYCYITDPNVQIQYYDHVKDAKGKLKSVKAKLVKRQEILEEIK